MHLQSGWRSGNTPNRQLISWLISHRKRFPKISGIIRLGWKDLQEKSSKPYASWGGGATGHLSPRVRWPAWPVFSVRATESPKCPLCPILRQVEIGHDLRLAVFLDRRVGFRRLRGRLCGYRARIPSRLPPAHPIARHHQNSGRDLAAQPPGAHPRNAHRRRGVFARLIGVVQIAVCFARNFSLQECRLSGSAIDFGHRKQADPDPPTFQWKQIQC